ncbi:TVP38/TMEM64 family protein [Cyanobium sp. Copco_Reservoir_LC18]|uniref:TVP38/TMEM64 family protein n=1 Tax=Cyanobium sp. Copco_Reservoir_LC18 TaxID=1328305 RepID=UPI001357944F|nr:VTT domain-containing protein [Cyanobium sp. Copco_Reservoir_LC18]
MDPLWLSDQLLPWLRSPLGAVAFVPLYALWVTLLLPGVWASMLAGVLYGPVGGSVLVFAGACLGAQTVFLLGRGRWRGWARRRLAGAPRLQAVERAVCHQGLVLVLLTRLSPAFPFSLLNLAYGLSEVSQRDYAIGLIGILPGTVLFCALGAAAGDPRRFSALLAGPADGATWALRLAGAGATLAAVLLVGRQVRQALEERGVASPVPMQASDGDGRDSPTPQSRRLP